MAFGNMNERGANRRPRPSAVTPPTVPAPPATPAGNVKPNIAVEPPMTAKPARPARVDPNAAPDPTKGALPPRFANMVKGGMTEAQARQKWARSLQNRGKIGPGIPGGGGGATTPPQAPTAKPGAPTTAPGGPVAQPKPSPFVPTPAPKPGAPVYGGPLGELQGQFGTTPPGPGSYGMPPMGGAGSPIVPGGNDFRDPMASFLAAVPMMNINTKKQIDDALSQFGGGGLRHGTDAAGKAAEIGAQASLQQNQMLTQSLMDYANQQENRALQATGMGIGLGGMLDQQAQDRVTLPFQLGAWEQQRADSMADKYYQDFQNSKLGWLPYMLGAAQGQHGPSQGTLVPMPGEPARPGAADWISLLGQFFG